jgi:hypothetical protein
MKSPIFTHRDLTQLHVEPFFLYQLGPYMTPYQREVLDHMAGKLRWMSSDTFKTGISGLKSIKTEKKITGINVTQAK